MNLYCAKIISDTEGSRDADFVLENLMVAAESYADAMSKIEDFYRSSLITVKELMEVDRDSAGVIVLPEEVTSNYKHNDFASLDYEIPCDIEGNEV